MNSSDRPEQDAAPSRGGDRRRKDRRREDRRAPVPPWRRPWAYVAYGVAGVLVILLLFSLGDDPDESTAATAVGTAAAGLPAVDTTAASGANAPVRDAYGTAGFEALLAEGGDAQGRRVRTQLYCEPIRSLTLRRGADVSVSASVARTADGEGRVPAADCRWGADATAPELLLVVPAELAERFASMPEVEQSFVRRREVPAEVVWIGRSEALALRNVAVLRSIGAGR